MFFRRSLIALSRYARTPAKELASQSRVTGLGFSKNFSSFNIFKKSPRSGIQNFRKLNTGVLSLTKEASPENLDPLSQAEATEALAETSGNQLPNYEDMWRSAESKLEEVEKNHRSVYDKFLRALAENENIKHRYEREIRNVRESGIAKFAVSILNVVDNFEAALDYAQNMEFSSEIEESFVNGIRMTHGVLIDTLRTFGIEMFSPNGEAFNPRLHEAASEISDPTKKRGTVVEVLQKGYKLNNHVLRPARVVVAK